MVLMKGFLFYKSFWNGSTHEHQRPITCSKWAHHKVQSACIERSIEWTGCESFSQGWTWGSFGESRGGLSAFNSCERKAQSTLIWAMKFRQQGCNFVSVSASLVMWYFHMFCGVLTNIGFSIMCGNIDYFV